MFKVIMSHKKEIEICQIFDLYIGRKHLKTSSDRRIIAICIEILVAEYNGDVRILIGCSEIAVFAQAH